MIRNMYNILVGTSKRRRLLGRPTWKLEDNIKANVERDGV
jgi:hypothetical protein